MALNRPGASAAVRGWRRGRVGGDWSHTDTTSPLHVTVHVAAQPPWQVFGSTLRRMLTHLEAAGPQRQAVVLEASAGLFPGAAAPPGRRQCRSRLSLLGSAGAGYRHSGQFYAELIL
ncbi:hypothetical protein [Actinophytocola sp.]|uniref:hypothetical protein n=1 Tax=Actinophytocola sp. TaxID=1872138 RepID=UPI002D7E1F5A|nr:hypothetical protein [Actinophytocola sp.]HET9144369.1 hypothetical protein [Actinophytocola sp.]